MNLEFDNVSVTEITGAKLTKSGPSLCDTLVTVHCYGWLWIPWNLFLCKRQWKLYIPLKLSENHHEMGVKQTPNSFMHTQGYNIRLNSCPKYTYREKKIKCTTICAMKYMLTKYENYICKTITARECSFIPAIYIP